jgi:hypothetical protein
MIRDRQFSEEPKPETSSLGAVGSVVAFAGPHHVAAVAVRCKCVLAVAGESVPGYCGSVAVFKWNAESRDRTWLANFGVFNLCFIGEKI